MKGFTMYIVLFCLVHALCILSSVNAHDTGLRQHSAIPVLTSPIDFDALPSMSIDFK